jgi:hypothetical protein
LRFELVPSGSDEDLFNYMHEKGILLVDCALCPLHKLSDNTDKILAATLCLKYNTKPYLNLNKTAPIITIFPYQRGFATNTFPEIEKRIINKFHFSRLSGLKSFIENYFEKIWN